MLRLIKIYTVLLEVQLGINLWHQIKTSFNNSKTLKKFFLK